MLSHTSMSSHDAPLDEEEKFHEPEHTSLPPIPPLDNSTLLASMILLTISHKQLCDDFYSTIFHFAALQKFVELHLTWI